jgi:hypothetical protein
MKALLLKTEKNNVYSRCPAAFRCLGVPKTQKSGCKTGLYGVIDCRNLSF